MKKITKLLCCLAFICVALVGTLAGCATVGNISNPNKEIVYNGGAATIVGDYVYYGNAFAKAADFKEGGDYKAALETAYVSRLNNKTYDAKGKDYSPKGVEYFASEVAGHEKSFMFTLGQYIYYATPNTQKGINENGETSNYYNYTKIYRSKLNGNKKKCIYTTVGEVTKIEALKFESTYYIVMLAGDKLISINLGNNKGAVLAEGVKSVALPKTYQKDLLGSTLDFNGYIYFTTDRESEIGSGRTGQVVSRIKLSGTEAEVMYDQGTTLSFISRDKDVLFFTEKVGSDETETYMLDLSSNTSKNAFVNDKKYLGTTSNLTDFNLVSNDEFEYGYTYLNGSTLNYLLKSGKTGAITFQNQDAPLGGYKVLFTSGRTVYVSTTTGIYRADLSQVFAGSTEIVNCETVVSMTSIYDGALYAFDGQYLYYFAKLEEVETENDDKAEEEQEEADETYYMYRARVGYTNSYNLIGATKSAKRRS